MRKKFRKITAIVLTAAMAFSVATPAFAKNVPDNNVVTDTTINIVTNEAFQDLFAVNQSARGISDDVTIEKVEYEYSFAKQEENNDLADVTLSFVITIDEQEYPVVASGTVNAYPLSSGDVLWENLIRGTVDIRDVECKVLVGFSKLDSSSDIQASVTIQAVNEEEAFNPVVFTFGEQIITKSIQREIADNTKNINISEQNTENIMTVSNNTIGNFEYHTENGSNFANGIPGTAQRAIVYKCVDNNEIAVALCTYGNKIDSYYAESGIPTTLTDSYRIGLEYIRTGGNDHAPITQINSLDYNSNYILNGVSGVLRPLFEDFLTSKGIPSSTITAVLGSVTDGLVGTVRQTKTGDKLYVDVNFGLTQIADLDDITCGVPIIFQTYVSTGYTGDTQYVYSTSLTYRTQLVDYTGTTAQWIYTDAYDIATTTYITIAD